MRDGVTLVPSKAYAKQKVVEKIRFHRADLETLDRIIAIRGFTSRSDAVRRLVMAEWKRVVRREKMAQKKLEVLASPPPEPPTP